MPKKETNTYSNRFAAHLIKQHQFQALCRERGWQYQLQGRFDRQSTPTLNLSQYGLRVEFWVETLDNEDATGSGIYLYISTDQVRFYRNGIPEPIALTDVPVLVFTEVMRDVDLFVGVCSVGNDPTWQNRNIPEKMPLTGINTRLAI